MSELVVRAEEPARTRASLEELLVRHTGRTPEQVSADVERETFLTAEDAVAYGLVDEIVPGRRPWARPHGGR
ncbi:ATP-dependent Clp protease proteolytic subunit [Streptomyces asoensis]|uniref:ATP-dependent Clp protease proteolytic subunit n=1 Tax=Streptomyces asoensis TaxID=249586 RepID=UPI00378F81C6